MVLRARQTAELHLKPANNIIIYQAFCWAVKPLSYGRWAFNLICSNLIFPILMENVKVQAKSKRKERKPTAAEPELPGNVAAADAAEVLDVGQDVPGGIHGTWFRV